MIDAQNLDTVGDVVNGVQDPVGAATSTEQPLEFPLEWFPDAAWEGSQVSENTLDIAWTMRGGMRCRSRLAVAVTTTSWLTARRLGS